MKLRIGTSGEMAHNVGYIPLILSVAESLEKFPGNARVFEVKKEYTWRIMSIEGDYRYLTAFQLQNSNLRRKNAFPLLRCRPFSSLHPRLSVSLRAQSSQIPPLKQILCCLQHVSLSLHISYLLSRFSPLYHLKLFILFQLYFLTSHFHSLYLKPDI